jgi:protein SCO1/2
MAMHLRRDCRNKGPIRTALLAFGMLLLTGSAPASAGSDQAESYARSVIRYDVPNVTLIDMDGRRVRLRRELADPGPAILEFMYTTCAGICPILSGLLAQTQEELGPALRGARIWSISIDPEADTPERLRLYAVGYDAKPNWRFLTGRMDNVVAVQQAFDAYRGNKMRHEPLIFLHPGGGGAEWVRLNGMLTASQLAAEYRRLVRP